jgi:hypothetical protein
LPEPSEAGSSQVADSLSARSVRALAYAVVREAAPGEVPYFDTLCEAYLDDPDEALNPTPRDSPAGSGFEVFVSPLTPIVVAAITGALTHALSEAVDAMAKRIRDGKRRGTKRQRRKAIGGRKAVAETVEAKADVGKAASEHFRAIGTAVGLPAERIDELCIRIEIIVKGGPAGKSGASAPTTDEA